MAKGIALRDATGKFSPTGQYILLFGKLTNIRDQRITSSGKSDSRGNFVRLGNQIFPLQTEPGKAFQTDLRTEAPLDAAPAPARTTAPPTFQRAPPAPLERANANYTTWFKAMGTIGSLEELGNAPKDQSPDLLHEDLEDFTAPAAWYSNQNALFGKVIWKPGDRLPLIRGVYDDGIVPYDDLIRELNLRLQGGDDDPNFDFRVVYDRWSLRYQVLERFGDGEPRPVVTFEDGRF